MVSQNVFQIRRPARLWRWWHGHETQSRPRQDTDEFAGTRASGVTEVVGPAGAMYRVSYYDIVHGVYFDVRVTTKYYYAEFDKSTDIVFCVFDGSNTFFFSMLIFLYNALHYLARVPCIMQIHFPISFYCRFWYNLFIYTIYLNNSVLGT